MNELIAEFDITYAYNQFLIYDESSGPCPVAWTDHHCRQGFCRSWSSASFLTLDQWGIGHVRVRMNPFEDCSQFVRLITVPFFAESGNIAIQGPEDPPPMLFSVKKGHYRLWVGQLLIADEEEQIDIFFESLVEPAERSEFVIQDEFLQPGPQLIED